MTETKTQANERLTALTDAGVSVWLDEIKRSYIENGKLEQLRTEMCLRGVTSNPAIFEKAILGSDEYDDRIAELNEQGKSAEEIYLDIAIADVQGACDVLRPTFDELDGYDGYVSLEVEPSLARDTDGTRQQAKELWDAVDRPNLFIKIPGTPEGLTAIEDSIADGINVNVTLLFSVEAYKTVMEAYIKGLERRKEAGESLDVRSVASFFVSRVDSEVDGRLDEMGGHDELKGTAAVANARQAYQAYKEVIAGERWKALDEAGAHVQRPLWASTGVKNEDYSETKYVDELIAPNTVNTMPLKTLEAAAESATIEPGTADRDPSDALKALADAGIDMDDVTDKLLSDGIDKFVEPFEKLLEGIRSQAGTS